MREPSCGDPERADAGQLGGRRIPVRGGEHGVTQNRRSAATNHRGASVRSIVAAEIPPDGQARGERDQREQRAAARRLVNVARPISQTNAIASFDNGLVRPSGLSSGVRPGSSRASSPRRLLGPSDPTMLEPDDASGDVAHQRSSWVATIRHVPAASRSSEDREQAVVAVPVLPECRLVEDEHRGRAPARGQRQSSLLATRQSVRAASAEAFERQRKPLHERVDRGLVRRAPGRAVTSSMTRRRQELALRFLEDVAAPPARTSADSRAGPSPPSSTQPSIRRSRPTSSRADVDLPLAVRSHERDPVAGGRPRRLTSCMTGVARSYPNVTPVARTTALSPASSRRQRPVPRSAARPRAARSRPGIGAAERCQDSAAARRRSDDRAVEGEDGIRQRPGLLDAVLDEDDRGGPSRAGRRAARRRRRSHPGRDSAVGSSRMSRPGIGARTPASARRCCWPPESVRVRLARCHRARPPRAPPGPVRASPLVARPGSRGRTRRRPRPAP